MRSKNFIGAGWAFPMGVSATGGIAMAKGGNELDQAIRLILGTYPGERPMRPRFGSRIRDFIFRNIDRFVAVQLEEEVREALALWEPRIDVETVVVYPDANREGLLYIDIAYSVKQTNDLRNLVFPFYSIPEDGSDY